MNMAIKKKYTAFLVIALVGIAAIFFFFYRMGRNDVKAIQDFSAAYKMFDQAILDFSRPVFSSNLEGAPASDDLERKADEALAELNLKASARISSLTKHDAELMSTTLEIADLSGKELNTLQAYKKAADSKNANLDQLSKEFGDLTNKRKIAYARFLELAGLKD